MRTARPGLLSFKQNLGNLGSCPSLGGSTASLRLGMVSLAEPLWEAPGSRASSLPKTRKLKGVPVWEGGPQAPLPSGSNRSRPVLPLGPQQPDHSQVPLACTMMDKGSHNRLFVCLFYMRVPFKNLQRRKKNAWEKVRVEQMFCGGKTSLLANWHQVRITKLI